MPAGIQVFNESGILQFDSEMQNVVLDSKIVIDSSEWGLNQIYSDGSSNYYVNKTIPADSLVAISSPNVSVGVFRGDLAGSFSSTNLLLIAESSSGLPSGVVVYLFRKTPPSSINFGIEVYDESGNLTFAPSTKLMRITNFATTPDGVTGSSPPATTTITTDATDAPFAATISLARMGFYIYTAGAMTWVMDGILTPSAGTSVSIRSTVKIGEDQGSSGSVYTRDPSRYQGGIVFAVSVKGL